MSESERERMQRAAMRALVLRFRRSGYRDVTETAIGTAHKARRWTSFHWPRFWQPAPVEALMRRRAEDGDDQSPWMFVRPVDHPLCGRFYRRMRRTELARLAREV